MKRILFLLTLVLAMQQLPAQPSHDNLGSLLNVNKVSYEPLFLQINGGGRITPFKDGQMLQVGHQYFMVAIPERGYVFKNWSAVNLNTEISHNEFGPPVSTTNIIVLATGEFVKEPILRFTMQAELIEQTPFVKVTTSRGWQANFVPIGR